jgi:hypothetical protein
MLELSARPREKILYTPPLAEAGFAGARRLGHRLD